MTEELRNEYQRHLRRRAIGLLVLGVSLVALISWLPHAGRAEGRSAWEVARSGEWNAWGDWHAAWCAFKLVLICGGGCLAISSMEFALLLRRQGRWSGIPTLLLLVPGLGVVTALYYLLKAIF